MARDFPRKAGQILIVHLVIGLKAFGLAMYSIFQILDRFNFFHIHNIIIFIILKS
jgi:hypothetical protein